MAISEQNIPLGLANTETQLPSEEYVPQTMPRILGTFDMTATFVIAIYALSSSPTAVSGGAAAFFYWFVGAVAFFVLCGIVAAQLGVMYPHDGSLYNWTYKAFGGFWSFFVGLCSWLPAPLVIVGLGVEFVSFLQGLNPNWLIEPVQQGGVILVIVIFSAIISVQRFQTVQRIVNIFFILDIIATALIIVASIVWLLQGNHSATDFTQTLNPSTINPANYSLYGLILFGYIGSNLVLNMSGEVKEKKAITRHLLWGSLVVFACYITATIGILIVQGDKVGFVNFSMASTVEIVFHSKLIGNICTVFFLSSIIAAAAVYNYVHARILMVAGIDRRLPVAIAKLNKNRVPANAIYLQTLIAVVFTVIAFMVVPYVLPSAKPADLNADVYFVSQAAATLVWATAVLFLFINLTALYFKDKVTFQRKRIFPIWVLVLSVVIGVVAITGAIVNTLLYSWTPPIDNSHWWYLAGGVLLMLLIISAVASLVATSEANWQEINR